MVGDLVDPIGFQVELREGRLLALHGQSYGQDTRAIDFTTTPFEEVFTLDETGESILYDPVALRPESPLRRLHAHGDGDWRDDLPPPVATPTGPPLTVLHKLQQEPTPESRTKTFGLPVNAPSGAAALPPVGPVALTLVGLYLLTAFVGLILIFALRLPFIMVLLFGAWLVRATQGKKGRDAVCLAAALDQAGVFARLNLAPGSMGNVTSDTSHSSTPLKIRNRP